MSGAEGSSAANPPVPAPEGWRRRLRVGEDSLVTLALGALAILPLLEIVLRRLFHSGISGANGLASSNTSCYVPVASFSYVPRDRARNHADAKPFVGMCRQCRYSLR